MDADGATFSPWDGHVVLLHGSEDERVADLAAWVARGLDLGEKVVLTEALGETHEHVLAECAQGGADVAAARRSGQLVVVPVSRLYPPPHGQQAIEADAVAEGYPRLRLSARASAVLGVMSLDDYMTMEAGLDRQCRSGPMSAICQYERPTTDDALLRHTLTVHVDGVRSIGLNATRGSHGVQLFGEVDLVNGDVLAAVVSAAVRSAAGANGTVAPPELVLDLSGLGFIDVAGCRALLHETLEFRARGGHVLLAGAAKPVDRALRLMEVDAAPGVRLVGASS